MKKVKITTIILAILLVTLIAFAGVYIKTDNRMENKVKEFTFDRELSGGRYVVVAVHSDEDHKVNEEDLTVENYEIIKKTIENRLKIFGANDYTISLNRENGTIIVELPENDTTDMFVYLLTASSEVKISEKDSENVLLQDKMFGKATYSYKVEDENKYQVYLQLNLTNEGQAEIEKIANDYAIYEDEISKIETIKKENEEKEESEKTSEEELKKIAPLTIAGSEYNISEIKDGIVTVKIGAKSSNTTTVNNNMSVAAEMAALINSGKYPIEYEVQDNRFVFSDITKNNINNCLYTVGILLLITFGAFIVKYKLNGLLVSISSIGYISILLIVLRYTNVMISIEGMGAILLAIFVNVIINKLMLEKNMNIKDVSLKLVPLAIVTIVCSFTNWTSITSFGMVMFWGLVLIGLYNVAITKTLLKLNENK